MNILIIGDIFGKAGRKILAEKLPALLKEKNIDLCIANAENIAHGKGMRGRDIEFLRDLGAHVYSGGNHSFDQKEIYELFDIYPTILRPANYPKGVPGAGHCIINNVLVINIMGRVFMMESLDSPFQVTESILEQYKDQQFEAIIVDFHAEATSEKYSMFHFLDGRVSAVVGTHTHVQTADERVSEKGTAYITDIGMTGPDDSVIGMQKEAVVQKFLTGLPLPLHPSDSDPVLCAVVIKTVNGKAVGIERIRIK